MTESANNGSSTTQPVVAIQDSELRIQAAIEAEIDRTLERVNN